MCDLLTVLLTDLLTVVLESSKGNVFIMAPFFSTCIYI